jgi:hypothetical protein
MRHQRVLVFTHFEKITFLADFRNCASAIGTISVRKLLLGEKSFARRTIKSFVASFIYVALVVQFFEKIFYRIHVRGICCALVNIVFAIHQLPYALKSFRQAVNKFLRRNARFGGGAFNLLPVFVRARQKFHIEAAHFFVTRHCVGGNRCVCVPDMRVAV